MNSRQPKKQPGNMGALVLERDFQATVIEMAETYGWECFYIPDSKRAGMVGRPKGWPDLVLAHGQMGLLVYAELKTDDAVKSRPTPEQRHWLNLLDTCGELVQLWRPWMWDHIERVLKGPYPTSLKALEDRRFGGWK